MSTQGLLERSNGYYFQARIPKQYLSHYPQPLIREKLPADNRKEAVALVRKRWAELHVEFERIDSTGSRAKTIIDPAEADYLIQLAVHTRLSADDEIRALGVDDFTYGLMTDSHEEADESARLAVARGILTPHALAIVSDWLMSAGYKIDKASPVFKEFAIKFIKAQTEATNAMKQRHLGIPIETPPAPLALPLVQSKADELDTLEKLRDYWLSQPSKATGGRKGRTAEGDANTIIKKFREMVGNLSTSQITDEHIVQLKDKMLAGGSSNSTINKSRGVLAAMFSSAKKNKKLAYNPCAEMEKLPVPRGEVEKPYNIQELQTIFNSPVYAQGFRPKRFNGGSVFWMPLLGLYTGARLNELGQLFSEDIGEEEGFNYLVIKPEEATGRSNKSGERRRVPIHPDLIKMGFLDYCHKIKSEGHQQLFPELKTTRKNGKLADKWGTDWWSPYVRKELGITRVPQPYHGLRHAFIEHGRRSKMDSELRRIIEGHAPNSVDLKHYGLSNFPIEPLYEEMVKLTFKGLNLSHLLLA